MKRTKTSVHIPHLDPDVFLFTYASARKAIRYFLLYLMLLCSGAAAFAQWSTVPSANNRVCFALRNQIIPKAVSDGAGGVIITWQDERFALNQNDVYAQRINSSGVTQWAIDGVAVATGTNQQFLPAIIGDGEGGAIIAWNQNPDIYAQRIDANGVVQWQANGIIILDGISGQPNPRIASDGSGGAIIVWTDYRAGFGNKDVYAQRVNAQGIVQWTTNGVAICNAAGSQDQIAIVGDGAGDAIITWEDQRGTDTTDIYAQRINASGIVQWTPNGVVICAASNVQSSPVLARDGGGGAIIAWEDERNASSLKDIYAQRISATGAVQWTADGVLLCNATANQESPDILRDDGGGAFVAWQDSRAGTKIYAQRINAAGTIQWTANGVVVSNLLNSFEPHIVRDGSGGEIVMFTAAGDICAQRVDASGNPLWTTNGVVLCNAIGLQQSPVIVADGTGGAIVTWDDDRSGEDDIYAQNVDSSGVLGRATAVITDLSDVSGDQGGRIRVTWSPSNHDIISDTSLQNYQVFRGERSGSSNPDTIAYTLIGSVPASQLTSYSFNVSTLNDSDLTGTHWYHVKIRARISNLLYWDSEPDSAYSIDNLAPAPPPNAQISRVSPGTFRLRWGRNIIDPDVAGYYVHRSTINGFVIADSTRIASTPDTTVLDSPPTAARYYYRITTVDIHGNEGTPTAQLSPLTGVEEGQVPTVFALEQNYPNPFNPSTTIKYELPERSHITLKIYDVLGREVAALVNDVKSPGTYTVQWDASGVASGVYFYRLQAGQFSAVQKMLLMR